MSLRSFIGSLALSYGSYFTVEMGLCGDMTASGWGRPMTELQGLMKDDGSSFKSSPDMSKTDRRLMQTVPGKMNA